MKAMIFAAGLGTRLQSLTNNKPKALVEINGKTLLERCIINLKKSGITQIVINVHHFSDQIIHFIQSMNFEGIHIQISNERDVLLDTGGGLLKAKNILGNDTEILLINVDVLTNLDFQQLEKFHIDTNALATLVVRKRETSRYLLIDAENQLCGWKNEKTGETKISKPYQIEKTGKYAFSGIHIINPKMLDMIAETGKFSIIDLYLRLAKTQAIKAFIDTESIWMDLGKYEQMDEAARLVYKLDRVSKKN